MSIHLLTSELEFPDPAQARVDGLLAMGGDLSIDRLLLAYERGIFPWYSEESPIMWWSPDPRCVLWTKDVVVSKSMRNVLNRGEFKFSFDKKFRQVIEQCRSIDRDEQGTWISEPIVDAYCALHELGVAHSVEVYKDNELVGGLYGVSLGRMFFGESMFSKVSNASKFGLIQLCRILSQSGFELIDCQIYNAHLGSLGALNISRDSFLEILRNKLTFDSIIGSWQNSTGNFNRYQAKN
jgi:leucyl/phenylalanyl-tRNA---protein transferase